MEVLAEPQQLDPMPTPNLQDKILSDVCETISTCTYSYLCHLEATVLISIFVHLVKDTESLHSFKHSISLISVFSLEINTSPAQTDVTFQSLMS
jgi:hypothetical protein